MSGGNGPKVERKGERKRIARTCTYVCAILSIQLVNTGQYLAMVDFLDALT